jgi:hypothetical protein
MKRIMQMAADEGYDRVAWTTGRMQADRYDLSKKVNKILFKKNDDGTYWLEADSKGEGLFELGKSIPADKLPDHIGKDLADKIVNYEPGTLPVAEVHRRSGKPGRPRKEYLSAWSGLDLKVGGEGMIKFYDEMLPKKAQKIARRLDQNAKVGQIKLRDRPAGPKSLLDGEPREVWSIDITPAMRKSIAGGQPLFSNPAAAAAPGLLSTQQPQRRIPRSLLDDAA